MNKPKDFKDIPGYEGRYAISKDGEVYSYPKKTNNNAQIAGKLMKPFLNNKGYYVISLIKNKLRKCIRVHRLVAYTYIPNPKNKPQINHKNFNKSDNRIENLEWCTASENNRYKKLKKVKSNKTFKGTYCSPKEKRIKKWRAMIKINGKQCYLGWFLTEKEAALAYNKKAKELFGEFAYLNEI